MTSPFDLDRGYWGGASNVQYTEINGPQNSSQDPNIDTINRLIREASTPAEYMETYQSQPASAPFQGFSILVSVEGVDFEYQFTQDDLQKVFQRYGRLSGVESTAPGTPYGRVTFRNRSDAERAISDLDNKILNTIHGRLRVVWDPYTLQRLQEPLSAGEIGAPGTPQSVRKHTCRFDIGIENDKEFQVARRIIGQKGANMKRIVEATGAKLRLRGKGSGYLEGPLKEESNEPLHLCISCVTQHGYNEAVAEVARILESVHEEYRRFRRSKGLPEPVGLSVAVKDTSNMMPSERPASTPPIEEFEYPSSPEPPVGSERRFDSGFWKVPT
jgi:hypothetical protein